MFSGPSHYAVQVDSVMMFIVVSSVILLLGVTLAMIYFVIRYSRKKNPKPENIEGNTALEIIWIIVPTILVLVMFYLGYKVYTESRIIPDGAMNVSVTGRMWKWQFQYVNGKQSDTLFLPVGKPVKLDLNSADVNHSFFIPAFRIKEDIIAGRMNYMVITPDEIGTYDIACAEYCGLNHSQMYAKLIVLPQKEFASWLNRVNDQAESDTINKEKN